MSEPEDMTPGDEAPRDEPAAGMVHCAHCDGSGEHEGRTCPVCGGSGEVSEAVGGG